MDPTRQETPIASTSALPADLASFAFPQFDASSLSPEVADADISIAPDGSFVETSSGAAARELKRRYDQHFGVCKEIRSPYVITAFVNQHGKHMYRVGNRLASAPAAEGEQLAEQLVPATRPQSRISHAPRKLHRKTRSIPDMACTEAVVNARAHSQSVTAADMPRYNIQPPNSIGDKFIQVLQSPPRSQPNQILNTVLQPFGPGVIFDSPIRRPAHEHHLATPRVLREMQSFESGLTARQVDTVLSKKQSAERIVEDPPTPPTTPPPIKVAISPLPETSLHSRYSTDVFDTLQTYRGLPLLDRLSPDTMFETTIKLSLGTDNTASPRDDPRFVIWGVIQKPSAPSCTFSRSGSHSDLSSVSSSKRSTKRISHVAPPDIRLPSGSDTTDNNKCSGRVLIAATIERWIAQLTSELNYDELLNFFLTYRTYISSVDLCHLLICRFHWALEQPTGTDDEDRAADDMARKIVRVRTFVAMRYWLLTFFNVDFVPNRELRLLLAGWLNTLLRDPVLTKHADGLSIVRKLIKVVKDCKKVHTHIKPTKRRTIIDPNAETSHLLGGKFAAATRKQPDDEDSDVDLDFLPAAGIEASSTTDVVNAHLNSIHLGAGLSSPTRPTPLAASDMLQQADMAFVQTAATLPIHHSALSRAFVNTIGRLGRWKRVLNNSRSATRVLPPSGPSAVSEFDLELTASPGELLAVKGGMKQYMEVVERHSTEARVVVPVVSDPTPKFLDIERHSLFSHDIEMTMAASAADDEAVIIHDTLTPTCTTTTTTSDDIPPIPTPITTPLDEAAGILPPPSPPPSTTAPSAISSSEHESSSIADSMPILEHTTPSSSLHSRTDDEEMDALSFRSGSSDSLGVDASSRFKTGSTALPEDRAPWQFDVVSIDELDFSDTSSDHEDGSAEPDAPPGLRRAARKLPLRRDFEFVRRSQSVSSMGVTTHESMASGQSSSAVSDASGAGLGGPIQQWQMNALVDSLDNEEETGDVEAALRRLEGQINPHERKEKASKVDGWIKQMQDRLAAGDNSDNMPRYPSSDEDDEDEMQSPDEIGDEEETGSATWSEDDQNSEAALARARSISDATPFAIGGGGGGEVTLASDTPLTHSVSPSSVLSSAGSAPKPDDAVPMEILQSRVSPSLPSSSSRPSTANSSKIALALPSVVVSPAAKASVSHKEEPKYKSWIIPYRAETLAEQFAMIDRELFMGVKFEELVLEDSMSSEDVDILDWTQFLKDRATWKAAKLTQKTSALSVVRARFNLMVNFTISEVCLTQGTDRAAIVSKFIRIAWKSYLASNFNALVAIVAGLTHARVDKAMQSHKQWGKVGIWETRIFKDFKVFVSPADDFKYLRATIDAMSDAKSLDISHPPSVISNDAQSGKSKSTLEAKAPASPACIPFIGVYLAELQRLNKLPDLIDPTAPNEVVGVDPETTNFEAPAHPEVFTALAPLPPSMQLEPLINVHKQRLIAGVIKSLVAGQHLAGRIHFSMDKRAFQRCLKLVAASHVVV